MYNGMEYAERRTLISSHKRAGGSHFISATAENTYNTSQIKEMTANEEMVLGQLGLADFMLPTVLSCPCMHKELLVLDHQHAAFAKLYWLLKGLFGHIVFTYLMGLIFTLTYTKTEVLCLLHHI